MKKIIAIMCILCIGLVLFVSGCTEQDDSGTNNNNANDNGGTTSGDVSKFIGTWDGGHFESSIDDKDETWIFYENNSLKIVDNLMGNEVTWATYEIDETGDLCVRKTEINSLMCYTFTFSDNDNQFALSLGETVSYRFAKSE